MGRFSKTQPLLLVILTCFIVHAHAFHFYRSIGKPDDGNFDQARKACDGTNQDNFRRGRCTSLITCVYNNTDEAYKARLASGTSITALLPTILALIVPFVLARSNRTAPGSPPLEIVQLAFVSPWRALATCVFSIGLPTGLFRQLRPVERQLSDKNPIEPRVREWRLMLPRFSTKRWVNIAAKGVMDMVIIAMAVIMFWRNSLIAQWTMVPFRCEWTYVLLMWPTACIVWLLFTMTLLLIFKESVEIYNAQFQEQRYSFWELMWLSYDPEHFVQFGGRNYFGLPIGDGGSQVGDQVSKLSSVSTSQIGLSLSQYPTPMSERTQFVQRPMIQRVKSKSYSANSVIVKVTMRSVNGLCSWRWFEAIIESLAFGIYLFATCVLTSLLFLTADEALWNLVAMTVCLSAVRVLGTLF